MGIEQNGYYFDQNDLVVNAYWSWEKVADLLPYNYGIEMTPIVPNEPIPVQPIKQTPTTEETIPGYN